MSRCASHTGTTESTITAVATTVTMGCWSPRARLLKIQSGNVSRPGDDVNVVTTISSNDKPNANRPPASSAVRSNGKVTNSGQPYLGVSLSDLNPGNASVQRNRNGRTPQTPAGVEYGAVLAQVDPAGPGP